MNEPPQQQLQPVEFPPGLKWILALFGIAVIAGILGLTVGPMMVRDWRELQIEENGTDATATLLRIKDTGDRHNERPVVQFSVEIHPEGGEPYRTTITTTMSPVELPKYKEGDTVRVRFDPEHPDRAALMAPFNPSSAASRPARDAGGPTGPSDSDLRFNPTGQAPAKAPGSPAQSAQP